MALRWIPCFCGARKVITRVGPERDVHAVCSRPCWDAKIAAGLYEYPGQREYLATGKWTPINAAADAAARELLKQRDQM